MVIGCGECLRDFQISSVRNWEAKCEMDPPQGSYENSSASEVPTLSPDKGKGVTRKGKGTATQAQLHAQEAAEFFKY